MPHLSIIAAVAQNRVIGRGGELPWRLSRDLRRFKELTMGHSIIMGRKTFESINRLLPGRHTIVVTRQPDWTFDGAMICHSLEESVQVTQPGEAEAFVIGGASLYAAALPLADRMYLTHVEADVDGDTLFPVWDPEEWQIVSKESYPADADNDYATRFVVYTRSKAGSRVTRGRRRLSTSSTIH